MTDRTQLNNEVHGLVVKLYDENAQFRKLLHDAESIHGNRASDQALAVAMIQQRAAQSGEKTVAQAVARDIRHAFILVLRRLGVRKK